MHYHSWSCVRTAFNNSMHDTFGSSIIVSLFSEKRVGGGNRDSELTDDLRDINK